MGGLGGGYMGNRYIVVCACLWAGVGGVCAGFLGGIERGTGLHTLIDRRKDIPTLHTYSPRPPAQPPPNPPTHPHTHRPALPPSPPRCARSAPQVFEARKYDYYRAVASVYNDEHGIAMGGGRGRGEGEGGEGEGGCWGGGGGGAGADGSSGA